MPTRFDVVVLGSGVAGTAAAIAAAKQGAHTCVISGGPGLSALFAGAWRGDCPDALSAVLAEVHYPLRSCKSALPHPYGHLAPCDLAPPAQEAAVPLNGSVIIGIAGLPGFDATVLAQQWSARAQMNLEASTIELAQTPAAGWSSVSLAGRIEREPDLFSQPLARAIRAAGASRVIVPPILGTIHDDSTRQAISAAVGVVVGEALGVPPSLPGWRLQNALHLALKHAGINRFESKGLAGARHNGRIEQIELMNGDVVTARCFVLATGKYAAGGIEAETEFREPALGCPVWTEHLGENFETVDSLLLSNAERSEDQPLLRAGVHTDEDFRPVNAAGDVVYDNVFVAGSIRAGWSISSHSMGDAAIDGWNAGMKASA